MSTKTTINAIVKSKKDTFANWSAKNPTLESGEIATVVIPTGTDAGGNILPPVIMTKVGDGSTPFNSLGWASALAADVYPWAKAQNSPVPSVSSTDDGKFMRVQDGAWTAVSVPSAEGVNF